MNVGKRLSSGRRMVLIARAVALLAAAALLVVPLLLQAQTAQAAAPALERIRVALLVNLPGTYTNNATAASLSGSEGLQVKLRGSAAWDQLAAGEYARVALDDYKVLVGESADYRAAAAVLEQVKKSSSAAWLVSAQGGQGALTYRVLEGAYASAADAQAAVSKWSGDAALQSLPGALAPRLAGPLRLASAPYTTLQEARAAAAVAVAAGLEAYPAVIGSGADVRYVAVIGAAADEAQLAALREQASAVEALGELAVLDRAQPVVVLLRDHTRTAQAAASDALYLIGGTGTKLWLGGPESGRIKLDERYGRSYRGGFELSAHNGMLAAVNELPFEHYLYSVVGAEMPASWSAEALKAQAVAARTYALHKNGDAFEIANVVDTVLSQAYSGVASESASVTAAVDATAGEVMLYNGQVIEALFSSSAGGATADASEVWGNEVAYLRSVESPDEVSEQGLYAWYRIALEDGRTGYTREDLLEDTGTKTSGGQAILRIVGSDVMVRPIPLVQSDVEPVAKLQSGARVVLVEQAVQSNAMSWVRGPMDAEALLTAINKRLSTPISGPIRTLTIAESGPSGRALKIEVNGQTVDIRYPDSLRSALGGLPSTRFTVDETGRVTVLGSGGAKTERPYDASPLHAAGADRVEQAGGTYYVLDGSGRLRAATQDAQFRFVGTGNGHGVGLSQYGARSMAEDGYDYREILTHYYNGITISKG
ncbi:SpoIID/LytB domain-containing protein [Paenibacillus sp. IB182496]|uniref:SpoIID/LytB domain-containing protein n=1 Tax=Paenibacillus sabuli TaxID=2772509 RepID=A0A927GR58_9BACL|nr:SpoIID/LytB domain-containing protein [Paenibacillus sabuli]MBD2844590.1 SpoIID/LytB domain-containing protein [Paenibacillus sabuli]